MRRRRFIQALAAAPAAPALLAQQGAQQAPSPAAPAATDGVPAESAPLEFSIPDEGADPVPRFFSERQFATLRRVCDLLMPAGQGSPGALETRVPEFMDFLIGDSPAERQQVWLRGLDALEKQSQARFRKTFVDIDAAQADMLFAPLRQPWTYEPPTDPIARLLVAAKQEVRTATSNSVERALATSGGSRRRGGGGLYWLPVD
jgi:gluconate 2-dehydrogenase subunit 3-like protein